MTIKNGDLPAMPLYTNSGEIINAYDLEDMITNFNVSYGLTKREQFAAMAMQGMLANGTGYDNNAEILAAYAVSNADALLAELNLTKGEAK